jgi:hypothetical protein
MPSAFAGAVQKGQVAVDHGLYTTGWAWPLRRTRRRRFTPHESPAIPANCEWQIVVSHIQAENGYA